MKKTLYCGLLRRDADGRWFYGERPIGVDGEPFAGALEDAMAEVADAPDPVLAESSAPAVQTSLAWPVEAPVVAIHEGETLRSAHLKVWEDLDVGTWCPCCQRDARRYPRTAHAEMAVFLVRLVRAYEEEPRYYHTREILEASGPKAATDASYFTLWGLVKRHPKMPGYYIPTPAAIAFVDGRTVIPKIAWVYAGRATHFSKELVTIREVLKTDVGVLSMLSDRAGPGGTR